MQSDLEIRTEGHCSEMSQQLVLSCCLSESLGISVILSCGTTGTALFSRHLLPVECRVEKGRGAWESA